MQTRSTKNLQNVKIKDLLLDQKKALDQFPSVRIDRRPSKVGKPDVVTRRERRRAAAESRINEEEEEEDNAVVWVCEKQAEIDEAYGVMQRQTELIAEQRLLIEHLRDKLQTSRSLLAAPRQFATTPRMLLLDTESFCFEMTEGETLLPLQLAWGIYEWNDETRELVQVSQRTIYVSELMCISTYRNAVKAVSENCFRRHEEKLKEVDFPLMTALQVLETLQNDVVEYNVDTVVGYNLSWDFTAIGQLVRTFFPGKSRNSGCPILDSFDGEADNPFNPMGLRYLDLMHVVVKSYGEHLVVQGIRDGTVHRAQNSNRIMLRKNRRYCKSIYSAEYVLNHFFGVTQNHLADDDVRYEALLLEKSICDIGLQALEYNILYPQQTCYQRMLHLANIFYEDPLDDFIVDDDEDDDGIVIASSDDEGLANMLRSLSAALVLPHQSQEEECLFFNSEEDHSSDEVEDADAASKRDR